jgi:hypothetical protein
MMRMPKQFAHNAAPNVVRYIDKNGFYRQIAERCWRVHEGEHVFSGGENQRRFHELMESFGVAFYTECDYVPTPMVRFNSPEHESMFLLGYGG